MAQSQKFLFDNDFAHPEEARKRAAVHTDGDLEAAKTEAYAAGQAAMVAEQRVTEEQQIAALVESLCSRAEALFNDRMQLETETANQAGALAISICRKVMPTLAAQNALTEIEGLVTRTIAEMNEEPRLVIRVADSKLDALQTRFDRMSANFAGKLVLLGDDEMAETDCAVLWADGGAERNLDRLWNEIDLAVAGLTDAQTQPDAASPLDGLPDPDAPETPVSATPDLPDAADAASAMPPPDSLTDTAKQESGHG